MSSTYKQRWERLIAWLEGRGMCVDEEHLKVYPKERPGAGNGLYTTRAISAYSALFEIPTAAHLDIVTLEPSYPNTGLTAIQMISLHLFLHRPGGESDSQDPLFGPYISMLPREFDSHPLTWTARRTLGIEGDAESLLLDLLPPNIQSSLRQLETRFWEDWQAVKLYLKRSPPLATGHQGEQESKQDYLWAWLNVNTRGLYHELGWRREDNISLCPIFDLANHTWSDPTMQPSRDIPGTRRASSNASKANLVCSTLGQAVDQDEELLLTYGAHSNGTLFAEYGFVNIISDKAAGLYAAEAVVDDIVCDLIGRYGDDTFVSVVQEILEQENYWKGWTMHSTPALAHPSYRLLTALRLLHVFVIDGKSVRSAVTEADLRPWRETIAGARDTVSPSNERDVVGSLRAICDVLRARAEDYLSLLAGGEVEASQCPRWYEWARGNVATLWREEKVVAAAVLEAVDAGTEF